MHEVTTRRSQSSPRRERVNSDAATLRLRRIALGGGESPETRGGDGLARVVRRLIVVVVDRALPPTIVRALPQTVPCPSL